MNYVAVVTPTDVTLSRSSYIIASNHIWDERLLSISHQSVTSMDLVVLTVGFRKSINDFIGKV
jgi:hypothetical protein